MPLLPNFVCVVPFRVCCASDGTDKQMDRGTDGGCAAFSAAACQQDFFVQWCRKKGIGPPRWPPSDWSVDHTAWELTGSETCKKSTRNTDVCSSRLGADSCSHHLQVRGIKKKTKPCWIFETSSVYKIVDCTGTQRPLCVCVWLCVNLLRQPYHEVRNSDKKHPGRAKDFCIFEPVASSCLST